MTPENRFEMPTVCSSLTQHNQTEAKGMKNIEKMFSIGRLMPQSNDVRKEVMTESVA
jgi:hypothetical protein